MRLANRIFYFISIFLISSSLVIAPILSSSGFYLSQKDPDVAFAQSDKAGDQPSASFPLIVDVSTSCPGSSPVPPGTTGPDIIYGTDSGETINGGNQDDQIFGCGGDDTLEGGNGADFLDGGDGDDTLKGQNGVDTLTGGPGADTFDCGNGPDTVTDYNPSEGDTLIDCENATVVDTTPPDTTIDSAEVPSIGGTNILGNTPPINTEFDSIEFTFSGTDNIGVDHFECKLDAGSFTTCTSPDLISGLSDGSHTFEVRAIDGASPTPNVDPTPASFTWNVDTTEPDTTIDTATVPSGGGGTDILGDTPPIFTEFDSIRFTFSGDDGSGAGLDPTAPFECQIDGGGFSSVGCSSPIDFTGLSDGSHTFEVRAIDAVGNVDPTPASFTWNVDTGEPTTTILSAFVPDNSGNPINDGDTTGFDSIEFTFSGDDGTGSGINHFECQVTGPTSIPSDNNCTSPKFYGNLADGTYTFTVKAVDNVGNDPAASFTWTISTPPPPPPPPGPGPGPAPAPAPAAPAEGVPITFIERQIFQKPYIPIACIESVVELQKDLIPTTDFPALVNETISTYNVTVLNVYNVPDYKAMLLAEGDEKKLVGDTRFLTAQATCGEMILELVADLVPVTNIFDEADRVVETYHVKVVDVINMTDYKAIVILAEPDNPITKDPRFVNYNEEYNVASNYTGGGELDLSSGHIAAPPPVLKEETIPDSIKRTFTIEEFTGKSKSEDSKKNIDVDIGILDTGIDLDHPDLNVYKNVSFVSGIKTGDDDNGHGTHVAGIAAAKDNGKGIIGGAPGARLWSIKVCDSVGECKISNMIKGVEYITQHADEIDVVNISVETPLSQALNRAVSASIKAGVTYVVAAGNYGHDASSTSPASTPDVITVSAIADSDGKCGGAGPELKSGNATDDTFAPFSNFGPSVSIAAPGVAILSTYLDGGYAVDSGTSMASPSVAAAAALIKANSSESTPKEVKETLLVSGSTPLTPCTGGPQGYFSGDPDDYKEPLLFRKLGGK